MELPTKLNKYQKNAYQALMDCNFVNFQANILQELGFLGYRISQKHILEPPTKI